MSCRNKKKLVYRAGTEDYPVLLDKKQDTDEVWLITNPNLYYPLDQDQSPSRQSTRANPKACLWEADITKSDNLIAKDHSTFEGVCVVKYKGSDCIENELESLTWVRSTVPKYRGGMSLMDDSTLVQAVLIYMKDHYPTTPQDFNSHAELKAACHWHWSDDDNRPLEPGPHDDIRVKSAAEKTLKKWENELKKMLSQGENKVKRALDLEEGICALRMYYDMPDMEEINVEVDETTSAVSSPPEETCSQKMERVTTQGKKRPRRMNGKMGSKVARIDFVMSRHCLNVRKGTGKQKPRNSSSHVNNKFYRKIDPDAAPKRDKSHLVPEAYDKRSIAMQRRKGMKVIWSPIRKIPRNKSPPQRTGSSSSLRPGFKVYSEYMVDT